MKITLDKEAEALSIVFREDRVSCDKEITPNVFAGFAPSGELVEIQILEVSKTDHPWFTLEAAAKYLNKSERTILRWIESRKLNSKRVGREYRIKLDELNRWLS
jgi:excisionase family DNA binding protein